MCSSSVRGLEPANCCLYSGSGAEDNVHALGTDDHIGDRSERAPPYLSAGVVDSNISASDKVNIVIVVALVNEVALDGLVDVSVVPSREAGVSVEEFEGLGVDIALSADGVDAALDHLSLDVGLLDGDNY